MILIIGGGVIGLSIAHRLAGAGMQIHVLERGRIGRESSWAAAGMLAAQVETEEPGTMFDAALASRALYSDVAAQLLEETGVDIELQESGIFRLARDEREALELQERGRWQQAAGLTAAWHSAEELRRELPGAGEGWLGALYVPGDKQLDNRKLVIALREAARRRGVRIEEGRPVLGFRRAGGRVVGVETPSGPLFGDAVVLAAGAWSGAFPLEREPVLPVFPVRGQMLELEAESDPPRSILFTSGGYLTPKRGGRVLAGATEENAGFDRRNTVSAFARISAGAERIWPASGSWRVTDAWAGFRPGTPDRMPLMGRLPGHPEVLVATGHFRNGILLAPVTAAWAAAELGVAKEALPADLASGLRAFDPGRFGPERAAAGIGSDR